jgi:hypothetical protein
VSRKINLDKGLRYGITHIEVNKQPKRHTMKACKMTKAHFEMLANLINNVPTSLCMDNENDRQALAKYFANELWATNPNFNCDRFLSACNKEKV